mmetsp:Transcript_20541/g.61239  ORF Transcript_20541/g.61239 Transcript_20541/m.61239 type:complete len:336 (+) Transcript_20541:244-1251(+)
MRGRARAVDRAAAVRGHAPVPRGLGRERSGTEGTDVSGVEPGTRRRSLGGRRPRRGAAHLAHASVRPRLPRGPAAHQVAHFEAVRRQFYDPGEREVQEADGRVDAHRGRGGRQVLSDVPRQAGRLRRVRAAPGHQSLPRRAHARRRGQGRQERGRRPRVPQRRGRGPDGQPERARLRGGSAETGPGPAAAPGGRRGGRRGPARVPGRGLRGRVGGHALFGEPGSASHRVLQARHRRGRGVGHRLDEQARGHELLRDLHAADRKRRPPRQRSGGVAPPKPLHQAAHADTHAPERHEHVQKVGLRRVRGDLAGGHGRGAHPRRGALRGHRRALRGGG